MGGTGMTSLWKLERAQTRLRMSRSQFGFWCKLTLLTWLCGTVVYFFVGIGAVPGKRSSQVMPDEQTQPLHPRHQ